MICAIFATDASGAFAYDNGLPWPRNKEDMNFFKTLTTNQVVVMGRSTWDSKDMLRPLPNRTNIVVTNKPLEQPDIMTVSGDIPTILDGIQKYYPSNDIFVIGGVNLLLQARPAVEKIYQTIVVGEYTADVKFDIDEYVKGYYTTKITDRFTAIFYEHQR
jgi:dihydrofolate reductase